MNVQLRVLLNAMNFKCTLGFFLIIAFNNEDLCKK